MPLVSKEDENLTVGFDALVMNSMDRLPLEP